jgi:hypothetical protein
VLALAQVSVVRLVYPGLVAVLSGLVAPAACSVETDYEFSDEGGAGAAGDNGAASGGRGASSGSEGGESSGNEAGETSATRGGSSAGGADAAGGTSNGAGATAVGGGSSGNASNPTGSVRGTRCSADADCADQHCADGVCCDAECAGGCQACVSSKTGQPNGTCAGVLAGTDPDDECTKADTPCGLNGMCNGAGSCLFAEPNTECADEKCAGGEYTAAAHCDGMGRCVSPEALACDNCEGNACEDTCVASTDCLPGFYCADSACVAKKVKGAACEVADECTSAQCIDGVCCDALCGSECHSCLLKDTGTPDGTCSPVKVGTVDSSCAATAPERCGYDGTCNATGDCRNWAQGTPCSTKGCVDDSRVVSTACNGAALCAPVQTESCGLWGCYGGECETSCSSDASCSSSAYCDGSTCIAKKQTGANCSRPEECVSNRCPGGHCCAPGEDCS